MNLEAIQNAQIETEKCLAPILRKSSQFNGLKISLDPISFHKYLTYRFSTNFNDWQDFIANAEFSTVDILYSGNTELAIPATTLLNESRYLTEGKLKVHLIRIPYDNRIIKWVEI